ncbi:septum site-determining protein Ssd [Sanguibacter sp. A247]|uniref:septum site-determining protein Ssd n=1 Tax=unclassified Sanguibacter TaxID=2645534 RepID=UPI003FD77FEE
MALWTVPPTSQPTVAPPTAEPYASEARAQLDIPDAWRTGPVADAAPSGGRRAPVLGVSAARGGSGASTLAAACAGALARREGGCVLVDLDEDGGGIDVLCGVEDQPGLRWADLRDATGDIPAAELRALLPRWGEVHVLSHDRARPGEVVPAALHDVLAALGAAVPLVLDLPRQLRARPPIPVDLHVLVVPRDLHGVAAAQRGLADLHPAAPVRLVTAGRAPGGLTEGVIADAVGADVVARLRVDRTLPRAIERGVGPSGPHLTRPALAVLRALDRATGRPAASTGRWGAR